jgi:hypothetical protein
MAGRDVELRAMLAAQQIALAWVEKLLWLEIEPRSLVRATVYISVKFSCLPRHDDREGDSFPRFVHTRKDEAYSAPLDDIINVADGVNFADLLHRYISLAAGSVPAALLEMQFPYLPHESRSAG